MSQFDGSLGRSAARGASVTMTGQLIRIAAQLAGVVILSRLLGPGDFGLLAMLTAIIGLGEVLRDFGLANAAIQAPMVTAQQRTNLLWINSVLGLVIAVAVVAAAPLIAAFYDEPVLQPVAQVLATTFLFNGIAAQYRASLARSLRFVALFIVDVVPVILGLAVGIALAVLDYGLWALVAQQVAVALLGLAFAIVLGSWLPGLPRRAPGMTYFLKYGSHLALGQIVAYVSRNVDYVVLGYRFGPQITGFYNRAFDLVINPLNQINAPSAKVAVPILSRLQDDDDRFDRYLLTGQKALLFASVPVLALGACLAHPLVAMILGAEWAPSAPIVQVLAIAAASRLASYATYWIALSRGATKVNLYVNLVTAPVLIGAVLIGSMWGAIGVAWGFAAATIAAWFVALAWYSRAARAPGLRMLKSAIVVFSASILPSAFAAVVLLALGRGESWLQLIAAGGTFIGVWVLQLVCVPAYRRDAVASYDAAAMAWRRQS